MRVIIGILALLPIVAAARDGLRHRQPEAWPATRPQDTSDRAFRTLDSGQEMEVLIRGDGITPTCGCRTGQQGMSRAAYLVDDKPAKLIVAETQAERDALAAELEATKKAFAEPAATIDALRNQTSSLTAQLESAADQVAALQEEVASHPGHERTLQGQSAAPLGWRCDRRVPGRWIAGWALVGRLP